MEEGATGAAAAPSSGEGEVMFAGVGSQSDLGSTKGLQARGTPRPGGGFVLLAGSIIAAAAPSLNPKFLAMRQHHLDTQAIQPSGGGCFRVMRDIEFKSASQAFVYAYGTRPPGGKRTWTPPGPGSRALHKHTAPAAGTSSPAQVPAPSLAPSRLHSRTVAAPAHASEAGVPGDDDYWDEDDEEEEEAEEEEKQPIRSAVKTERDDEEEEAEADLSETEAELAYIEAKIRLLQIRKKKLLGQHAERKKVGKPSARKQLDL